MYVQATGQYLLRENLVKGKKWYSLTADYAFGHDLLRVAKKFMETNGGQFAADELVPTDAADFSPYLLKIRQARPDLVVSNLAGNQITNFLKQYAEYGLPFPVAGFGFDTVVAWGAGKGNFSGIWPLVWHHLVDTPSSKKYVDAFQKKYPRMVRCHTYGRTLRQLRRRIREAPRETSLTIVHSLHRRYFRRHGPCDWPTQRGRLSDSQHSTMREGHSCRSWRTRCANNPPTPLVLSGGGR
jgi:hypothetical protein